MVTALPLPLSSLRPGRRQRREEGAEGTGPGPLPGRPALGTVASPLMDYAGCSAFLSLSLRAGSYCLPPEPRERGLRGPSPAEVVSFFCLPLNLREQPLLGN